MIGDSFVRKPPPASVTIAPGTSPQMARAQVLEAKRQGLKVEYATPATPANKDPYRHLSPAAQRAVMLEERRICEQNGWDYETWRGERERRLRNG